MRRRISNVTNRDAGLICIVLTLLLCPLRAQHIVASEKRESSDVFHTMVIAEGTPVSLRFAQPVKGRIRCVGQTPCASTQTPEAKAGDGVRLVAASDVRIDSFITIAKGALAQATVTRVWRPFMAVTGLALQLDWVEDVTGKRIPLKIEKTGRPGAFTVQVWSTPGGMQARPEKLRGDLLGKDALDPRLLFRKRNWIPAGTRITGFVAEATTRPFAEIKDAQALLPNSPDVATLTVLLQKKGEPGDRVEVDCDGANAVKIGGRQYAILELAPGNRVCRAEEHRSLELTAQAGEDYFADLQRGGFKGTWQLKLMDAGAAEDILANLELVGQNYR